MGIDPGVAHTGFGVVRVAGGSMAAIDGGVIETPASDPAEVRLAHIYEELSKLVEWHEPKAVALEEVYFGKNVRSAIAVGQTRGVAMLAAARRGVPCFDYTPQAVKMAVCGVGSAAKEQVQRMVAALLALPELPRPDHAGDALAVAVCHAARVRPRQPGEAGAANGALDATAVAG